MQHFCQFTGNGQKHEGNSENWSSVTDLRQNVQERKCNTDFAEVKWSNGSYCRSAQIRLLDWTPSYNYHRWKWKHEFSISLSHNQLKSRGLDIGIIWIRQHRLFPRHRDMWSRQRCWNATSVSKVCKLRPRQFLRLNLITPVHKLSWLESVCVPVFFFFT